MYLIGHLTLHLNFLLLFFVYISLGNGYTKPVHPFKKEQTSWAAKALSNFCFDFLIKFCKKFSLSLPFSLLTFASRLPILVDWLRPLAMFLGVLCRSNGHRHRTIASPLFDPDSLIKPLSSFSCTKGQAGSDKPISP